VADGGVLPVRATGRHHRITGGRRSSVCDVTHAVLPSPAGGSCTSVC
jgi:hypothetical protein